MSNETTTPQRPARLLAPSSDPSMDEALARARRIDRLDEETRIAASHVRRPAVAL